mgnify:CR=1 FL=1
MSNKQSSENQYNPFGDVELTFPLHCQHRVIGDADAGLGRRLEHTLAEFGFPENVRFNRHSTNGAYASYIIEICYESRESMRAVTNALSSVKGVRIVV